METEIIDVIKNKLKSRGVTQKMLADDLKVSLTTVKRWYSGRGINLSNLKSLSDYLELSLTDLFALIENKRPESFNYNIAQENALAKEPKVLAFFDYLVRGKSVNFIKKKFNISERELTKILLKLDKIQLIELHPENKIKLLNKGEPVWNDNGPLSQRFKKEILEHFLSSSDFSSSKFFLHDYNLEDALKIKNKMKELELLLKSSNQKAILNNLETKSFGVYFSLKEFSWNMDRYLK